MSDSFWRKVNYGMGLAAIGVLFGLAVLIAHTEIRDLDVWLHLGVGRYIVQNWHVPQVDILSCTISGKPWINHEWLFQSLVYLMHEGWGIEGIVWMQVIVVTVTLLFLLFLGYHKDRQLLTLISLLLVLLVYQTRFTTRPDLFSLLFFVFYIYILSLHIDKRWSVAALFIVQVLWSNVHGFFFFGPLFVLIALGSEWLKRSVKLPYEWNKVGRLTNDEYKRLKLIFIVVVVACLFNLSTFKGAWYPIGVFMQISGESKIFFEHIQELQRPVSWGNLFSLDSFPFYKLLMLLSIYSFIFNRRQIDVGVLIFWFVFLGFSLMAIRNLVFFAFAAYLAIVTNAITISVSDIFPLRFTQKKFQHLTSIIVKIIFCGWMFVFGFDRVSQRYFDFDKFEMKSYMEGISQRNYPYKAVDFLVKNKIEGNAFNDFNSGAYLIGRTFPSIKVFIDGRTEVYGPAFFNNVYQKIWKDGDTVTWEQAVKDYNLTIAFLNSSTQSVPTAILKYLCKHKDWKVVYFDHDAVILLKDVPQHQKWIKEFGMDLSKWPGTKLDFYKLGPRRVSPYQFINRAFTLETLDWDDPALKEAQDALRVDPVSIEPYKIMGKIYGKKKDYEKAFENFRIAASLSGGAHENLFNLAQAYYDLEQYKGAIGQYKTILNSNPKSHRAHFLLARAFVMDGQYPQALEVIRTAHQLAPQVVGDLMQIGDILFEHKKYEEAITVYQLALETKKDLAKLYNKVGLTYKALGRIEKAQEEFRKGLNIDANNEELKENFQEVGGSISQE